MRKPKTWIRWDDAQDEQLTRLVTGGVTHRQVAAIMCRPLDSIRSRCRALKLRKPPGEDIWPDAQMDFLIERYNRYGWSCQRIGDEMPGEPVRTASGVQNKARGLGLPGPDRHWSQRYPEAMRKRCLMLAMRDYTSNEIAREMGVSSAWVLRKIAASPYHALRYKQREGIRRSHAQAQRHLRKREAAA